MAFRLALGFLTTLMRGEEVGWAGKGVVVDMSGLMMEELSEDELAASETSPSSSAGCSDEADEAR